MILNEESVSMAEASEFMDKESNSEIIGFVKKFTKMKPEKAKKLRKKLDELAMMKMKSEYISKVIDVLPENKEEVNKIFTDVGLDEDETKKILEIVKEYK